MIPVQARDMPSLIRGLLHHLAIQKLMGPKTSSKSRNSHIHNKIIVATELKIVGVTMNFRSSKKMTMRC